MKKVLHILPMNQLSGAEKMALLICKNLTQYESIVVTGGEVLKEVFESNGIQSYSLNFSKKKLWSTIKQLHQIININQVGLLHAHDNTASLIAYLTKRIYRLEVKIISHIHNCYPWLEEDSLNKKIDRYLRPKFDFNIACGKRVYDYYVEYAPYFEKDKTLILSNAMDLNEIQTYKEEELQQLKGKYRLKNEDFIIGFIGRLSEQKGLIPFIYELANVKNQFIGCKFLIVGCGEQEEVIRDLVTTLQLTELFVFTGFQANVYPFYQLIDLFFLPSLYEGLPMVLLEAMAYGKPVVSMNVGSISEVLNEENGRLIEAGDTVNFVEALRLLKSQYEICQELGIKAKQEIKERFNITKYNEQLVNLYREVEA